MKKKWFFKKFGFNKKRKLKSPKNELINSEYVKQNKELLEVDNSVFYTGGMKNISDESLISSTKLNNQTNKKDLTMIKNEPLILLYGEMSDNLSQEKAEFLEEKNELINSEYVKQNKELLEVDNSVFYTGGMKNISDESLISSTKLNNQTNKKDLTMIKNEPLILLYGEMSDNLSQEKKEKNKISNKSICGGTFFPTKEASEKFFLDGEHIFSMPLYFELSDEYWDISVWDIIFREYENVPFEIISNCRLVDRYYDFIPYPSEISLLKEKNTFFTIPNRWKNILSKKINSIFNLLTGCFKNSENKEIINER